VALASVVHPGATPQSQAELSRGPAVIARASDRSDMYRIYHAVVLLAVTGIVFASLVGLEKLIGE
jgi:hypothetical protein